MNKVFVLIMFFGSVMDVTIQAQAIYPQEIDSINNLVKMRLEMESDTAKLFENALHALTIAQSDEKSSVLVDALQNLSRYHQKYGQLDSAIFYLKKVADIYKSEGKSSDEANIYLKLKNLYSAKGDYTDAQGQVFRALALFESTTNQKGIATCFTHLCDLLYYEDKYEESINYCDKAIEIQEKLDDRIALALTYRYKASSQLFADGKINNALFTINKAIDLYQEIGETGEPLLASVNGRGNILKYMERYDEALADYKSVHDEADKQGLERYAIPSLGNIGHVYIMQEKYDEALPYHLEAIERMKKTGNTKNLWENYMHVANIYESTGRYQEALKFNNLFIDEYETYLYTIIDRLENENQIRYETAKKDEVISDQSEKITAQRRVEVLYFCLGLLLIFSLIGMYLSRRKIQKKQEEVEQSRRELEKSLDTLKSTQSQLIQSEKMASLGELTAGIAHEIQNPLNFVNNFSEVNSELIDEMKSELKNGNYQEVEDISNDIKTNGEKIKHHGKRAEAIVKSMLQHFRVSSGEKELTDINALCDEYLRLAYHGIRARDKSFNADFKTDFDVNLPKIDVIPQDIGRVLLNLINNAFYAVMKVQNPAILISTKKLENAVEIRVTDNGPGISDQIKEKIFQPFFTTKPTGQGTGLGLSLSYDIVKAHGGEIRVNSEPGLGTTFIIKLPIDQR